jgi:hypothetical protein
MARVVQGVGDAGAVAAPVVAKGGDVALGISDSGDSPAETQL